MTALQLLWPKGTALFLSSVTPQTWNCTKSILPVELDTFGLDAFHPARIRLAFTISFRVILPVVTIGLASYPVVLEGPWLKTKNPTWRSPHHFWSKISAVNFGMDVVSELVIAYQLGTNWSGFSEFAGSTTRPSLAYEVLTTFFLEAGLLGAMLFNWNRIDPGLHLSATCMVTPDAITSTL